MSFLMEEKIFSLNEVGDSGVTKWANKIFSDARVRSKLKDRNYRVKIIEDIVLTRNATLKALQPEYPEIKISEEPISVGVDAVVFTGSLYQRASPNAVVIKVWNKNGKSLYESKKNYIEKELTSQASEFQSFWAKREFQTYEKLRQAGVSCPMPIYTIKNVLVLENEGESLEEFVDRNKKADWIASAAFNADCVIIKSQKQLYSMGLVLERLNPKNVSENGVIFEAGQTIPTSNPDSQKILFQNCSNMYRFYVQNGLLEGCKKNKFPNPHEVFSIITGSEYSPPKQVPSTKYQDAEDRKTERKSERAKNARSKCP